MSFIQSCFIRKNTSYLRKKLEKLGYNRHPSYGDNGQYLYLNHGFYHTNVVGYSEEIESMIDCGTNEELFIALAALRDDTPINSYYWFNDKLVMCYSIFDLNINQSITYIFQSTDNPKIYFHSNNIDIMRKATTKEIIEHFKDK